MQTEPISDERKIALNEAISIVDDLISDSVSYLAADSDDCRRGYRNALDRTKVRLVELYTGTKDEDLYEPPEA